MSDDTSLGKQINKSHFIALVKEAQGVKSELSSISGDFGERLKAAQDNANLNLKAFRFICGMDRMDEMKRNALWDQLQLYHDFAQAERWGGDHVGDLDKMARAASSKDEDEGDEPEAVDTELAASLKNAEGIGELAPEVHAENQKPRRGRARTKVEDVGEDPVDVATERGRVAWLNREPGKIPADLEGKPAEVKAWLDAWEAGQIKSSKERDAAEFERNPPRAEALPGASAPGSYELTH